MTLIDDSSRYNSAVEALTPAKVCTAAISFFLVIVIVVATKRPDITMVRFEATRNSNDSRRQVQKIEL